MNMYPILNEEEEVERILDMNSQCSMFLRLILLARYYIHSEQMKSKEVRDMLHRYLMSAHPDYTYDTWNEQVSKAIGIGKKSPLKNYGAIKITRPEMELVDSQASVAERRMLFTLIVLAKYHNAKAGAFSNWINESMATIKKFSNNQTGRKNSGEILHEFYTNHYLTLRAGIGDLAIHMNVIDQSEEDVVLELTDLRRIGYSYMAYKNPADFGMCEECGILFKQNKQKNRKYCDDCRQPKQRAKKPIVCIDCGQILYDSNLSGTRLRCNECRDRLYKQAAKNRMARVRRQQTGMFATIAES